MSEPAHERELTFACVYAEYTDRLRRHARRSYGTDLADDIVQETLFRFWRHLDAVDLDHSPWCWLRTTMHHVAVDLHRSRDRAVPTDVQALDQVVTVPDPLENVVDAEGPSRIDAALSRLSEPDRELLRALANGTDLAALARRSGTSGGAIRVPACCSPACGG